MKNPFAAKAVYGPALNGKGNAWGVEDYASEIYPAMFVERTARRLARLCNENGGDWDEHQAILEKEGYDLNDPAR